MPTSLPPGTLARFTTFGDFLRFLRRRTGLTQLELAIAVGYSDAQVSRLEQNLRLPDPYMIEARFISPLGLENEPDAVARLLELAAKVRREDAPALGLSPYKGLNYFDEADAELFVGREALTAKLLDRVLQLPAGRGAGRARFLAIVGASGSGKSSLTRAGLVPALHCHKDSAHWPIHVLTPTGHPLASLVASLTQDGTQSTLAHYLAAGRLGLCDCIKQEWRTLDGSYLLLIVDQFEELFTLCRSEPERTAFIDNLLGSASAADGHGIVVIALRADFYAHCASYPALRQALAAQQEYMGAMSDEETRRAIEEPARRGQWEFEPGLVDLILHDVGHEPGALPLLSHALMETWQRRRGRLMTLGGYTSSGGVRGAIAETAEAVFTDQFTKEQQDIARRIFLRLTELGEGTEDTRRRAAFKELYPDEQEQAKVSAVLQLLAEARLVTLSQESAGVAHEALIREWGRLRDWLNADREGLRLHSQLAEAAHDWEQLECDPGALYRGAQEQTRNARRLRSRAYYLAGAFLLALVLAGIALFFGEQARINAANAQDTANRADRERRVALTQELAAYSVNNLDADPERSILLALQALSIGRPLGGTPLSKAEEALHSALNASRVRLVLRGHQDEVRGVAVSPDGQRIATFSYDGTARVWDSTSGRELFSVSTGYIKNPSFYFLHGIAYSPDGKILATTAGEKGGRVVFWDANTGARLDTTFCCADSPMSPIRFSPDGTRLLTVMAFAQTTIIWDVATQKQLKTYPNRTKAASFSPDGTRLAMGCDSRDGVGSQNCTGHVWNGRTGAKLFSLVVDSTAPDITDVKFSPDEKLLVTTGWDGKVRLWEASTGKLVHELSGHPTTVITAAFSADGTQLVTNSTDGTTIVWDTASGNLLMTLRGHEGAVYDVAFIGEGKSVVTAGVDGTARVWDTGPGGNREWLTFTGHWPQRIASMNPSYDGKQVVSVDEAGVLILWDTMTGQALLRTDRLKDVQGWCSAALRPDGKRLAVAAVARPLEIWDAATGEVLQRLDPGGGNYPPVAEEYPVAAGNYPAAARYSPDGKYLVTAFVAPNNAILFLEIWDLAAGAPVYRSDVGTYLSADFSPDSEYVALAGGEKLDIYRMDGWERAQSIDNVGAMSIGGVDFSLDGTQIAGAVRDGIQVWDAATGKKSYLVNAKEVYYAGFTPDGQHLVAYVAAGEYKVWDLALADQPDVQPVSLYAPNFATKEESVGGLGGFTADGKRMIVGMNDGTVRVWALDLDDLIGLAKSRLTRTLTKAECQLYLHVAECPAEE